MARIKNLSKKNFTIINNACLRDSGLSMQATGLLAVLLSLPEYQEDGTPWNFSIRGLTKMFPDGRDRVQNTLQDLEKHGYLLRRNVKENGRFVDVEYVFSDEVMPEAIKAYEDKLAKKSQKKSSELPHTENTDTVTPCPENTDTVISDTETPYPKTTDNKEIYIEEELKEEILSEEISINQSIDETDGQLTMEDMPDRIDRIDKSQTKDLISKRQRYEELIKRNIEYDYFISYHEKGNAYSSAEIISEILTVIVDTICSTASTIRVNGNDMPQEVVKATYLKLNSEHIEYVLGSMNNNSSDIKNIRSYLITTLYNAVTNINTHITSQCKADGVI